MRLTPLEISKQEFKKTLRGFDPIEVRTFLEMVAEQFEKQLDEMKSMNNKMIELETQLKNFRQTEKDLRETLFNVQEVKKQSEESSKRRADLVVKEAELKSIEILENARKQARQIREEVNWLKSQKESFINRLRHILISQVELLSVLEIDDTLPEEVQKVLKSGKSRKHPALQSNIEEHDVIEEDEKPDTSETPDQEAPRSSTSETESGAERSRQEADAAEGEQEAEPDAEGESEQEESEEPDINDYFKKGIQIDELIENLNKKDKKK